MAGNGSNGSIICDAAGNLVAGYGNTALGAPQPALVTAGSDYAATPKAQLPKVDAFGTQYVASANPAGGSSQLYGGQPSPALAQQYGSIIVGRQDLPAPSAFYPLLLDQTGSLQTHLKSKVTFTVAAVGVTCGTNVILIALQNASTMIVRLSKCAIYIPPAGGSSGALLGQAQGQSYYPVFCELRRVSSYTGGTAIAPVASDSADILASGISCVTRPTSLSGTSSLFIQGDAYATNMTGIPFYERGADANAKTFVVRPGEAVALVCTSNGVVNSSTAGGGTVTASATIMLTFTQASA